MVGSFTNASEEATETQKGDVLAQVTQQSWDSNSGSLASELVITELYLLFMP